MSLHRPRISPTVLAELARRVNPNNRASRLQNGLACLFASLWLSLILAAPVLLLLLLFGLNFTVQWLIAAAWLLVASLVALGLGFLVAGVRASHLDKIRPYQYRLLGGSILLVTLGFVVLGLYGTSDQVSPFVPLSAAFVVATIMVGFGVHLFRTLHQALIFRLFRLIGMIDLSTGIIVSTLIVQADALMLTPATLATLRTIQSFSQPIVWSGLLLLTFGGFQTKQKQRQ
jgi:hypothetical protein